MKESIHKLTTELREFKTIILTHIARFQAPPRHRIIEHASEEWHGKYILWHSYIFREIANELCMRHSIHPDTLCLIKSTAEHTQPALLPQARLQRLFSKGIKMLGNSQSLMLSILSPIPSPAEYNATVVDFGLGNGVYGLSPGPCSSTYQSSLTQSSFEKISRKAFYLPGSIESLYSS